MIDLDNETFRAQVNLFDTECVQDPIVVDTNYLENSTGSTIDKINELIETYDDTFSSVNSLYVATSNYLHKVMTNIYLCEADNNVSE